MNGLETLKNIRSDEKFKDYSGGDAHQSWRPREDVEKCKELGAQGYWVKANLSLNELLEKINIVLSTKKIICPLLAAFFN